MQSTIRSIRRDIAYVLRLTPPRKMNLSTMKTMLPSTLRRFVTVFRYRRLLVNANSEEEATSKAEDKFAALQNANGWCDQGQIDSLTKLTE